MSKYKLIESPSMASPVMYTRGRSSGDRNAVTRRVTDRLRQQIDSVFVPNYSNEDEQVHLLMESDDQSTGTVVESPYYRHLNLHSLLNLNDLVCETGFLLDAVIIDDEWMYFILEGSSNLHSYRMGSPSLATTEDVDEDSPLTVMPLKIENGENFYPEHLRFEECNRTVYMSGYIITDTATRSNLLLKLSIDNGQLLNRSKLFPVIEKFGDFDLISNTSPNDLWIASNGTSVDRPDKCQVFKLSGDFRKKLNFIDLNTGRQRYTPNFVTSDGNFVYVSVTKVSVTETVREEGPENAREEGRILTFPEHQRDNGPDAKTQEWLHVNSWDFQALSPGKIISLSAHSRDVDVGCRLLVVDRVFGSLHLIVWRSHEPSGKPLCLPIRCSLGSDMKLPAARRLVLHKNRIFVLGDREVFTGHTDGLLEDPEMPTKWGIVNPNV